MASEDLHSDLMSVPGVASADVDVGIATAPAGVRVRLMPGADAEVVGSEVQRVLAAHGLRSRIADDDRATSSGFARGHEPRSGSASSDDGDGSGSAPAAPAAIAIVPDPGESTTPIPAGEGVTSVALEERVDRVEATVTLDDGRSASRTVGSDDQASRDAAVARAVLAAMQVDGTPVLIDWAEVEGSRIVTVVVRMRDGSHGAGAGVATIGNAFAVAVATRAAST